jgi:hypothetical protein
MPAPVIHIVIALAALLLYFDDRHRKYVLLLLPLAVLPDLDHFAPFYAPREMFHNVFLLVLPLIIALYGLKIKNKVLYDVALMAGFCLFSHIVLDFFNGGVALIYPLQTAWYGFANLPVLAHSSVFSIPKPLRGYVPSEAFGMTLVFVALAVILFVKRQLQFNTDVHGRAEHM